MQSLAVCHHVPMIDCTLLGVCNTSAATRGGSASPVHTETSWQQLLLLLVLMLWCCWCCSHS